MQPMPKIELPGLKIFDIGEIIHRIGIKPEVWEDLFQGYLDQLLVQYEGEILEDAEIERGNLSPKQLATVVVLVSRLGAGAALVAVDSLLPDEPPF